MREFGIAFEPEDIGDSPDVLYRVVTEMPFGGRSVRHVQWFATGEDALAHVERIEKKRGWLLAFARYEKKVYGGAGA